jgi:acetyl esterase/lipase
MKPEEYRTLFLKNDLKRDEGLEPPEDIIIDRGISYGPYGDENIMDIYRPVEERKPLPVIVSIHGGGWVSGSILTYQYYCMSLVYRGFAVVNFNYRLAPETTFPGMLEDINAVMTWIMENGSKYDMDTSRIFVVGDSAGAQLASQYITAVTNKEFGKLFPFKIPEGLSFKACALNCGVYDAKKYILSDTEAPIRYFVPEIDEEMLERFDTTKYITSDFPPTYVMSSSKDFLRQHAQPMYSLLCNRGVEARMRLYGMEDDPRGHVFHLNIKDEMARSCNDDECDFFRRHLN